MAWIESHQTLKEHPKTYKLMDLLNINKAQALGHLHLFWWWCVDYAPTGVLKDCNDLQVARAAEWSGEPKIFCNALVTAKWLDRDGGVLTVHDWAEFTLHFDLMMQKKEQQREQTRERVRAYRERKQKCNADVTQCNAPTKPNQTQPKHCRGQDVEASPALKAAMTTVYKKGFNIYALLGRFKKDSKLREPVPDEVLMRVCAAYERENPPKTKHWPYFMRVMIEESRQYFANRNMQESEKIKNVQPSSLKEIIAGVSV